MIRAGVAFSAIFSGFVNVLALGGSIFMLQVYDRVLPSKSVSTLVALLIMVVGIYLLSGLLDMCRSRIMMYVASMIDAKLSRKVFDAIAVPPTSGQSPGDALRPAQDMDQIRAFLAGPGPLALFDIPWMPFYLGVSYFIHPWIGLLAASAMIVMIVITIVTDFLTRASVKASAQANIRRNRYGEASARNAEVMIAMGMTHRVASKWNMAHDEFIALQNTGGNTSSGLGALAKAFRYTVQSATLALGAYLVIDGQLTAGAIIAASVIVARALAPVEQIIGTWRGLLAARDSWGRLRQVLTRVRPEVKRTALPYPKASLVLEGVSVNPPGENRITAHGISFEVKAGTIVGVIGPSGSGKSSLVRAITGVWPIARGRVRLDGADLMHWPASERGRLIGYLPQTFDLFPATIAENICRLDPGADDAAIVAAAQAAGVHDLILTLPEGYQTRLGEGSEGLSAGQRQRVALARALYGDPFLVVLDEPNSNLDGVGELALLRAMGMVRERGGIVVVVAHRKSILSQMDQLLLIEDGVARRFGPTEVVMKALQADQMPKVRAAAPGGTPLTVVPSEQDAK